MSEMSETAWVISSSAAAAASASLTLLSASPWLVCIRLTARAVVCCSVSMVDWISWVESWVRRDNTRTSSATTAKPRPCSPARAASMAAFSASRLVCSAMPWMVERMPEMAWAWRLSSPMTPVA
ncbi:hypothetical protein D3C79_710620 [compost metagenome]